ncbi:LETM1 domain-containing protein [Hyalangium sp.]|uniref:LETM1 domain-containing protein n=1 Tax=Hyalangium sp. TaxID=2028555 RepID=UPI002D588843|nr:LETM1 domain-containing protein [Hyalangium sp.]HYI00349.1 LETM1 domain-containing protein [Hyalangium sp.]
MDLGKAGWLSSILEEAVAAHSSVSAPAVASGLSDANASGRAQARAYLRQTLRASGLLYGTPMEGTPPLEGDSPAGGSGSKARAPEEQLFLAVVRTLARMALDIALLTGASTRPSEDQLLLLFAVFTGELDVAETLNTKLQEGSKATRRLQGKVEGALARRAISLAGDPVYGLVLHNGALYADAQMFGRQAIDYFSRERFHRAAAQRRIDFAARQKALLVKVLAGLSCADREPSYATRRAILRQVEDLALPSAIQADLKAAVKKSFEHRLGVRTMVAEVRSKDMQHFILEQTLLASLVDGQRSRGERAFIQELANALRVPDDELHRLELEMAEFYARHRSVVDVFTVSAAAGLMGEDFVSRIQETLEKNLGRLMQEVRETGDLAVLLAKVARGQSLTRDERRRMKSQIIDVAKAIPALAIFAAPGGVLLLIALSKVLPFSLLPSSFQDEPAVPPLARLPAGETAAEDSEAREVSKRQAG